MYGRPLGVVSLENEYGLLRGEYGLLRGECGLLRGEHGLERGEYGLVRVEIEMNGCVTGKMNRGRN